MQPADQLLSILDSITGTGKFSLTGATKPFLTGIRVHDEDLALPIPPSQARYLISLADKAPYGKGSETIHDDSVRKTWQIDAAHIRFPTSSTWKKYLDSIQQQIIESLSIRDPFIISPYKLLIYETGGHFLPHTDTEKIPHMFGSLIVSLPSAHTGGALHIRHQGQEITLETDKSPAVHHAAFFSDCEHEVKPITSGYRICLAFNLALKAAANTQLNQSHALHIPPLIDALNKLKPTLAPTQLHAILLNHQYTEENFSLSSLKNEDFTKAQALFSAAKQSGYRAYLALATLYQMGALEGGDDYHDYGRYGKSSGKSSNDDETMGEIYEDSLTLDLWRDADDHQVNLGCYHISNHDFLPPTDLDNGCPDEKEADTYTGNAGCTMEYWYRKAVIVIWPETSTPHIRCTYDLLSTGQEFAKNPHADEALPSALTQTIIRKIQQDEAHSSQLNPILTGLAKLNDQASIHTILALLSPKNTLEIGQETWEEILTILPHESLLPYVDLLTAISEHSWQHAYLPTALPALLAKFSDSPLIRILLPPFLKQPHAVNTPTLHLLLAATTHIDKDKTRSQVLTHILQDLSLTHIRTHLAPALLDNTAARQFLNPKSAFQEVLGKAIAVLEKEISRPIEPYTDWARPYSPPESISSLFSSSDHRSPDHFSLLETFCQDPNQETFGIAAAQHIRSALENHIRNAKLDFITKTIEKGRPYTLQLTKTDASYHRALQTRQSDIKLRARLISQQK